MELIIIKNTSEYQWEKAMINVMQTKIISYIDYLKGINTVGTWHF